MTLEPDWLSEHVDVLPEDRVRIDDMSCCWTCCAYFRAAPNQVGTGSFSGGVELSSTASSFCKTQP